MYQLHSIASGRQKHVALDLLMGCSDLYLTDAFPDFLYLSLLTFKPKAQSNRPKKGSTCMSAHAAELSLPIPSFSLMVGLVGGQASTQRILGPSRSQYLLCPTRHAKPCIWADHADPSSLIETCTQERNGGVLKWDPEISWNHPFESNFPL